MIEDPTPSGEFQTRFEHAMEERERVKWHTAEEQVEAFVAVMARRYGITEEEIPDLVDVLRWTLKHRKTLESIQAKAWLTLMGLGLTGLAVAMWEGIKALIGREVGGHG